MCSDLFKVLQEIEALNQSKLCLIRTFIYKCCNPLSYQKVLKAAVVVTVIDL